MPMMNLRSIVEEYISNPAQWLMVESAEFTDESLKPYSVCEIEVKHTDGHLCERCRNYTHSHHEGGVCDRCAEVSRRRINENFRFLSGSETVMDNIPAF